MKILMRPLIASLIVFFFASTIHITRSFAADAPQWHLPVGAIAHLGGEAINDIAYSPDGELLAAASANGIWLYDTVTHQEVTRLVEHTDSVVSISFSPDGKMLASGDSSGNVYLWDVATGTRLWSWHVHSGRVSISFRPDGKKLASAGRHEIFLWDVATGRNHSFEYDWYGGFQSVLFSPDARMLAGGVSNGEVYLWDAATGRIRHTFKGHTDSVLSVAFNPSGLIVASAGLDQTVRLWNVITGELRHTLEGHTFDVNRVSFRPDGRILASAVIRQCVYGVLSLASPYGHFRHTPVSSIVSLLVRMVRRWQARVRTGKSFSGRSDGPLPM